MITYLQLGRHGNTGNSMFQFAALVGASIDTGFDFGIPNVIIDLYLMVLI